MTGRSGDQLEQWGVENIRGTLTSNSGAVHEDADMLVDNDLTGRRVYEMKSSVVNKGITINRVPALMLLQRGVKLGREPVFIYKNAKGIIVAITPLRIVENKFGYQINQTEEMRKLHFTLQHIPRRILKGNNIRVNEEELQLVMELDLNCMIVQTKNDIPWVIMDAMTWLELSGDKRAVKNLANKLTEEATDV